MKSISNCESSFTYERPYTNILVKNIPITTASYPKKDASQLLTDHCIDWVSSFLPNTPD